jgi:hypothetical protein
MLDDSDSGSTGRLRLVSLAPLVAALTGCVGSTGGDQFEFDAYASGAPGGTGASYSFTQPHFGYRVNLTRAELQLGGIYLNRAVPTSVSTTSTTCTLPGIYSAEVPAELSVNLLSPELQRFPTPGHATSDPTHSAEIWLNRGDVNDPGEAPMILAVEGTAEKDGSLYPFRGELTIGANRLRRAPIETPGLYPICKERIVGPFAVSLMPRRGGHLVLSIDPASLFASVDFSLLSQSSEGVLAFDDGLESETHSVDQASRALYAALTSTAPYRFSWSDE